MAISETNPVRTSPGSGTTERPVPLWAERVARLLPLVALPVCLWRLPIGFGHQMGMDVAPETWPRWQLVAYVLTLSLLTEAFALLCRGLVRPWGETVPHWVPKVGGKRIPPFLVIVPAALSGLLLTALLVDWALCTFHIGGFSDVPYTNPGWQLLASVVSGLFALWGPMVLALTYAYWRRHQLPITAR
ncbi:hypothetical protein [Streptomyces spectabilis]|uniref:DUF3995 domain-containing protein n=1 Tax=Streptomyces spectabilis TaxID=68270 RepID=A0A5P2XD90_STRST|nr:hypothetical protein [Streptomyces spectabilis]MBB5103743.1 hypothetical protein [Streptomyces spectabilis]MCI3904015.1 hypothetical protein [Streptomyces spectabilis]QEV61155.1 hypothetical protein CP982_22640 [Streptomyces spectabilis]GGV19042.1 hypothetical protein GCM10010245_32200 [Streptomyces spectabilis]